MESESDTSSTLPSSAGTTSGTQDATLDEACRILAISASVDAAKDFVELLKASTFSSLSQAPLPLSTTTTTTSIPHIVPYTLSNRYYTADLHFALWPLDGLVVSLSPYLLSTNRSGREEKKLAPAAIFVWVDGEPYAKHIEQLSQTMQSSGYEPEVCLAVRIPKAEATQAVTPPADRDENTQENEDEDNADIDSTLMSFGFEYVDATQERSRTRSGRRDADDEDDIDIPGLPRVFDALSTIMWPSMRGPAKSSFSKLKTDGARVPTRSPPTATQQQERISIMGELLSISEISGLGAWSGSVMIGQEVEVVDEDGEEEELGTPVDFNYGFERKRSDVPWLGGSGRGSRKGTGLQTQMQKQGSLSTVLGGTGGGQGGEGEGELTTSPTDMHSLSPFGEVGPRAENESGKKISIGFDDDFTVFVSAPAPGASPNTSVEGIIEEDAGIFKDGLGHDLHTNPYRSLGSVSDFGGSDFGDGEDAHGRYEELEDADEEAEGWEDGDEKEWEGDGEVWDNEEEEGLPSKAEVRQTAARIFGGVSVPVPSGGADKGKEKEQVKGMFAKASDVLKDQQGQDKGPPPSTKKRRDGSAEMKERMAAAADIRGAQEEGAFDLERVLHSLQAMRSEIAGIGDEDEKRKMAARVALGLVYGLEGME